MLICAILLGSAFSVGSVFAQDDGSENPVKPNQYVELTFTEPFDVTVTATIATQYPPPPFYPPPSPLPSPGPDIVQTASLSRISGIVGFVDVWDIKVSGSFPDSVIVKIYTRNGAPVTQMLQTDFVLGDVNHDGKVNLLDLRIITNALNTRQGSCRWNPNSDLNCDHKVDVKDLCIAIRNLGRCSRWEDITFESGSNYVMGVTDHFSLFGVR